MTTRKMFDVIVETKTGPEAITDIHVDTAQQAETEAMRLLGRAAYAVLETIEYTIENGAWVRNGIDPAEYRGADYGND